MLARIKRYIFKVIEYVIYLGLCCIAAYFMKDVIYKYQANETYLGQSLKPITKLPTVTLCMDHDDHEFKISNDLTISYYNNEVYEPVILQEKTLNHVGREVLELNKIMKNCFKINSTSSLPIDVKKAWRNLEVATSGNAIPNNYYVYVTSESNYYGIYLDEYFEGKPFSQKVSPGNLMVISFTPIEYIYREKETNCTFDTFFHQWKPHIDGLNFSHCPEKCSGDHDLVIFSYLPPCTNNEAIECVNDLIDMSYDEFTLSNMKRPCQILEYDGTIIDVDLLPKEIINESTSVFHMTYKFSTPELTTEYKKHLVFDTVNMIGSVGGTLGMCIGFSFSGIVSTVLEYFQSKILTN